MYYLLHANERDLGMTNEIGATTRALDLTNQRFGSLMYVRPLGRNNRGSILWVCVCDCGRITKIAVGDHLHTNSCSLNCVTHSRAAYADITGVFPCKIHGNSKPSRTTGNSQCSICTTAKHKERKRVFKLRAIKVLGGSCKNCGYTKCPNSFDFHHKVPEEKSFNISDKNNWVDIARELRKTELLCSNCHREEQFLQRQEKLDQQKIVPLQHPSHYGVCKAEYARKTGIWPCDIHGESPAIKDYKNEMRCYACRLSHSRDMKISLKIRAVSHMGGSCQICGYSKYIGALEFHHILRSKKNFAVCSKTNWEKMVKEMTLCQLLCSNCHREEHASERD